MAELWQKAGVPSGSGCDSVADAELCRGPWTRNADGLPGAESSLRDNQEEMGTHVYNHQEMDFAKNLVEHDVGILPQSIQGGAQPEQPMEVSR